MAQVERKAVAEKGTQQMQLKGAQIQRALRVYALVKELSGLIRPATGTTSDFTKRVLQKIDKLKRRPK